jgi:FkbM family methyltransferase
MLFSGHWNMYRIRRVLLAPYISYMRHKERHVDGLVKTAMEATCYSPAFYRFMKAIIANPDLLHEAPDLDGESVIFDVGGFDGDWSARVFEKYQAHIYCFEVAPAHSTAIAARFRSNPKLRCFEYGLSGENATLTLSPGGPGSTLYAHCGDAPGHQGDEVQVPVRDIVEVMDELGVRQIDFMKLNIEGGEYDLLERMIAADRMADVVCLAVQFHEWLDGAWHRRRKIRDALKKTHREAWGYPWCWEQWVRK